MYGRGIQYLIVRFVFKGRKFPIVAPCTASLSHGCSCSDDDDDDDDDAVSEIVFVI